MSLAVRIGQAIILAFIFGGLLLIGAVAVSLLVSL